MNRSRGTSNGPAPKMVPSSTLSKLSRVQKQQQQQQQPQQQEQQPAELTASCSQLRHQLKQTQRALKRTGEHLRLQETRSRQLVTACAVKLRERQADSERQLQLKDRQFQHILQQLAVLQSRLKREQKTVTSRLQEQEQLTQQQSRELERVRRSNRRLVNKVNRLSEPCSRCGAKPDSGISDCDDADEQVAKVARRSEPDTGCDSATPPSSQSSSPRLETGTGRPEGAGCRNSSDSSDTPAPASPPGIMKMVHEPRTPPATPKTVTFSLQEDKENEEQSVSGPPQCAPISTVVTSRPVTSRPAPTRQRPLAPLQPRIITPPSVNINGKTYGQPSIVDTISQLLGADLEWPAVRRPSLVPKKLSVIPEGNESSRDELSEPEYENVRVETLGESSIDSDAGKGTNDSLSPPPCGGNEKLDNDVQGNNYRNVPRSRFNINLIMSESEGVQIKDNFEEFKFDDDMASSVCSDSASERSADNSGDDNRSLLRRAGDGAESEQTDNAALPSQKRTSSTNGNYDKFLELAGLSQKSMRTSARMLTNHRNVLRPKDVKLRQRVRMPSVDSAVQDLSPTSVRYYSEQL